MNELNSWMDSHIDFFEIQLKDECNVSKVFSRTYSNNVSYYYIGEYKIKDSTLIPQIHSEINRLIGRCDGYIATIEINNDLINLNVKFN